MYWDYWYDYYCGGGGWCWCFQIPSPFFTLLSLVHFFCLGLMNFLYPVFRSNPKAVFSGYSKIFKCVLHWARVVNNIILHHFYSAFLPPVVHVLMYSILVSLLFSWYLSTFVSMLPISLLITVLVIHPFTLGSVFFSYQRIIFMHDFLL